MGEISQTTQSFILYSTLAYINILFFGIIILGILIITGFYKFLLSPFILLLFIGTFICIPLFILFIKEVVTIVMLSDSWAPFIQILIMLFIIGAVWVVVYFTSLKNIINVKNIKNIIPIMKNFSANFVQLFREQSQKIITDESQKLINSASFSSKTRP